MRPRTPWHRILSARTTSQAIELAADVPLPELNDTPLPLKFEQLSFRAQENARAVRRALGVKVLGLTETGWELWEKTEEDREFFRDANGNKTKDDQLEMIERTVEREEVDEDSVLNGEQSDSPRGKDAPRSRARLDSDRQPEKKKLKKDNGATEVVTKAGRTQQSAKGPVPEAVNPPTPDQMSAAEALKNWAISSRHTTPPTDAIETISRSGAVPALLRTIVTEDALPDLLAPITSVFTETVGSAFANNLMNILVIPYAKTLKAPAPRDIMQALVSFSERHWRVGVTLHEFFAQQGTPVNGAVAEIMVRIAAVITLDGAMQGLRAWCEATWGEDGIRIVEALLGRCKTEAGVAGLVVPALERNVIGSEKSVRFGKLLFTVVRDLPGITEDFDTAMESICSRSTVFLAKRALTLLRGKRSKT